MCRRHRREGGRSGSRSEGWQPARVRHRQLHCGRPDRDQRPHRPDYYDFSSGEAVAVYQGETKEAIHDGYFDESTLRSAPYFALHIDGIIEDSEPVA